MPVTSVCAIHIIMLFTNHRAVTRKFDFRKTDHVDKSILFE